MRFILWNLQNISQHHQKQYHYPSMTVPDPIDTFAKAIWKVLEWFHVSKPGMISKLSLSEYLRRFSMGPVNFRCQMNFPFATCFKHSYGLVLSRYCAIVSCSLPSPLQSAYLSWKDMLIRKGNCSFLWFAVFGKKIHDFFLDINSQNKQSHRLYQIFSGLLFATFIFSCSSTVSTFKIDFID